MIPPITGCMTRATPLVHADRQVVLDIEGDGDCGTIEFRTTGRNPDRWRTSLRSVFEQLVAAPVPTDGSAPLAAGDWEARQLRPMTYAEIHSELHLDDEMDEQDRRRFLRWLYGRQKFYEARGNG